MATDKYLREFVTDENKQLFEEYQKSKLAFYKSIESAMQAKFRDMIEGKVLIDFSLFLDEVDVNTSKNKSGNIKKLYHTLMKKYHPDKDPQHEELCKTITKMYEQNNFNALKQIEEYGTYNYSIDEEIDNIEKYSYFVCCVGSNRECARSMYVTPEEYESSKQTKEYLANLRRESEERLKESEERHKLWEEKNKKLEEEIAESNRKFEERMNKLKRQTDEIDNDIDSSLRKLREGLEGNRFSESIELIKKQNQNLSDFLNDSRCDFKKDELLKDNDEIKKSYKEMFNK